MRVSRKIKLMLLCLIALVSLVACETPPSNEEELAWVKKNIRYIKKDNRCYAVLKSSPYGSSFSITHIPCNSYE